MTVRRSGYTQDRRLTDASGTCDVSRVRAMLITVALACTACEHYLAGVQIDILQRSAPAIEQESDIRLAEDAAASGILQLEGFYVAYGKDARMLPLLVRATCGYAAGFLADRWEAAALAGDRDTAETLARSATTLLDRCRDHAHAALEARFARVLDPRDASLASATRDDAEMLYWLGTSRLVAASLAPRPRDVTRAIELVARAVELDDQLDHQQGHVVLGIAYASLPASLGGDPERGRAELEHAIAATNGRLLVARVMLARFYAVTTHKPDVFDRVLGEVVATSPAIWPEQRLANELAVAKARRYLTYRQRWF